MGYERRIVKEDTLQNNRIGDTFVNFHHLEEEFTGKIFRIILRIF